MINRASMPKQMKDKMKKKNKKKNMDMKNMYAEGGKLKMVTNDQGQKVPFFAADGKGKMMAGGKVKKMMGGGMTMMPKKKMMGGGKVKKYGGGGKVRGCGVARKGVKSAKMVTMAGA
jgi:hypothetical protein